MSDNYLAWVQTPWGKRLSKALSLPQPSALLRRVNEPAPLGNALIAAGPNAQLLSNLASRATKHLNITTLFASDQETRDLIGESNCSLISEGKQAISCMMYDASGLQSVEQLQDLHRFFRLHIRQLGHCARVLVLGRPPEQCQQPHHRVVQRALEGFVRSLCKELRHGSTGQLIYVAVGAETSIDSTLRFLGGPRSAYVSGQVIRLQPSNTHTDINWQLPLAGKTALVTGSARGIGAAIAKTLAADGAHVIGLDVPAAKDALDALMNTLGGRSLALDITDHNAPEAICQYLKDQQQTVDIVVHNAGVTRDKLLANMDDKLWQLTLNINLDAPLRINQALLDSDNINHAGRIIAVSSISGIAGNAGQTNYSASKAGIVGMVDAFAAQPNNKNITCNAVAPGFIETEMTAKVPFLLRQAGRRMNSLKQGGLPDDVAETIAWMASPASGSVNGNTVRVCGQSFLGA